ncbi:hypothetical protein [Cellulomonas sp. RIT-PI-Y]|uniref:hypothetical protein n=1 Tax=Cellulomonas sp. RIT-PI-Y TaxID=3035297 RepID=UPI0021DB6F32|nr:hypothetical protein [Cellulomonas sp. RIT-PI-Y]
MSAGIEPTGAQVEAFRIAWHNADRAGRHGRRVHAGLKAALSVPNGTADDLARARQALNSLVLERNAWARQLADLRDERDAAIAARQAAEAAKVEVEVERDQLALTIETQHGRAVQP